MQAVGQARQAGGQRQAVNAHQVFLDVGGNRLADAFLGEPAQTPEAFHLVLELVVGAVGGVKVAQDGVQAGVARREGGRFAANHRHQLALVDKVHRAAQRRAGPGVLRHAQADVRLGGGDHFHLALGLRAVNRREAGAIQLAAPFAVDQNHQLGHQLVHRRAALAAGDDDLAVFDGEVVIQLRRPGRVGLAAPHFQRVGEFPQPAQLGLVRVIHAGVVGQGVFVEQRLQRVVAQVGGDKHLLDPAFVAEYGEIRGDFQIHAHRRAVLAFFQGEGVHRVVRQHGDLVTGEVHGGQAVIHQFFQLAVHANAQRRRGDVHAHAPVAVVQAGEREGVVDFGGGGIVNRKRLNAGIDQLAGGLRRGIGRKPPALGEVLHQETGQQIVRHRRNAAGGSHQTQGRLVGVAAGGVQGFPFQGVFVRAVQERHQLAAQRLGDVSGAQLGGPFVDLQLLLATFFLAGQRGLEGVFRRGFVVATALAVEIHRRAMQAQGDGGGLDGRRRMAPVIGGQRFKLEFIRAAAFPQEIHVDVRRGGFGLRQKVRQRRSELQQHMGGFDFAALAVRRFDLQAGVGGGHDGANLEAAVFFVKHIHRGSPARESG